MHFSSLKPSVQPSARKAITRPIGSEVKLNSSAGHKLTISRIWQVMTEVQGEEDSAHSAI